MKVKKLLNLITSAIIAISSISLTAFVTSAESEKSDIDFKSSWTEELKSINNGSGFESYGYYLYASDYETYKLYENDGLAKGYDKAFFQDNVLLVNWMFSFLGKSGCYDNPVITVDKNNQLVIDYKYNMMGAGSPWIMHEANYIEFNKDDIVLIDFSNITSTVVKTFESGNSEEISINMKYIPPKASDIDFKSSWYNPGDNGPYFDFNINDVNGAYLYIEDYATYKLYEKDKFVTGYNETFFKDNMLVVNWLHCYSSSYGDCEKPSITTDRNNRLVFDYICNIKTPPDPWHIYEANIIEFKKSDVKNIDFSGITVNVRKVYWYNDIPTENVSVNMKHVKIDLPKDDKTKTTTTPTTQKPTKPTVKKPAKVTKVKLKSPKKKQLKVTWKKIKGAKYQVQYSLKKSMKKSNLKNTKKNKIVLKKLKSNKKYYIRVRAYKTVNGKTYLGKWSKKAVKVVK